MIIILLVGTFNRKGWSRPRPLIEGKLAIIKGRNFTATDCLVKVSVFTINKRITTGGCSHCFYSRVYSVELNAHQHNYENILSLRVKWLVPAAEDEQVKHRERKVTKFIVAMNDRAMSTASVGSVFDYSYKLKYPATPPNRSNFFTRTFLCSFSGQTLSSFTVYAK